MACFFRPFSFPLIPITMGSVNDKSQTKIGKIRSATQRQGRQWQLNLRGNKTTKKRWKKKEGKKALDDTYRIITRNYLALIPGQLFCLIPATTSFRKKKNNINCLSFRLIQRRNLNTQTNDFFNCTRILLASICFTTRVSDFLIQFENWI